MVNAISNVDLSSDYNIGKFMSDQTLMMQF